MKEIFEQALLSYNLPFTVALCLVALFWIVSLLGVFDIDVLDFDLDADPDLDMGGDLHGSSAFHSILRFFNAADVPTTMILSMLALFMWAGSLTLNYYFNEDQNEMKALAILGVNFIGSLLLIKAVTQPLRPVFRALKQNDEPEEAILGSIATVRSRVIDQNFGQIEVKRTDGTVALLNAKLREGEKALVRGNEVLVFEKLEKGVYHVREAKELAQQDTKQLSEVQNNTIESQNINNQLEQ